MFQGVVKSSTAFRLMQAMGWEEGNGLGKDRQGMKEHLRAIYKKDNHGIGLDKKTSAQANWELNTMAYDTILQKMKVVGVPAAQDANGEDDSDDVIAGELQSNHKEDKKLNDLKVTRPQGRYKRREAGKMVGKYSKTDMAAILGDGGSKTVIATQYHADKKFSKSTSHGIVEEPSIEVSEEILSGHGRVIPVQSPRKASKCDIENKFQDDWWGIKYGFVRAGCLGATSMAKVIQRTKFSEQDQEDLFNVVQGKASKGRNGLGRREAKLAKVKGVEWTGQKKVLNSGSDSELDEATRSNDKKGSSTSNDVEKVKSRKRKSRSEKSQRSDGQ